MISEPRWQTSNSSPEAASAPGPDDDAHGSPHPLDALFKHAAEAREYALLYLETRKDQLRVVLRQAIVFTGIGLLALTLAACILIVAAVLLLVGIARGIGMLLGDNLWAGEMITGGAILLLILAGIWFVVSRTGAASRRQLAEKYERKRAELRKRFGREPAQHISAGDRHE